MMADNTTMDKKPTIAAGLISTAEARSEAADFRLRRSALAGNAFICVFLSKHQRVRNAT